MENKEIRIDYICASYDDLGEDDKYLIDEAKRQTSLSYAPYSQFSVGAAVLLDNGKIVGGNNQENIAYPSGLCAERTAMFYANSQHPNNSPVAIAIAARNEAGFLGSPICPCGSCRQVLLESERRFGKKIKILLYGTNEIYIIDSIADIMPFAFVYLK